MTIEKALSGPRLSPTHMAIVALEKARCGPHEGPGLNESPIYSSKSVRPIHDDPIKRFTFLLHNGIKLSEIGTHLKIAFITSSLFFHNFIVGFAQLLRSLVHRSIKDTFVPLCITPNH